MIHMTSTARCDNAWTVFCRCPWLAGPFDTQQEARDEGDAHLDATNSGHEAGSA